MEKVWPLCWSNSLDNLRYSRLSTMRFVYVQLHVFGVVCGFVLNVWYGLSTTYGVVSHRLF